MPNYLKLLLSSRNLLIVTSVAIAAGLTTVSFSLRAQSSGSPDLVIQNLQFVRQSSDLSTIEFDVGNVGSASVTDWFSMAVYIDGSIYTHTYYIQQNNGTQYGVDANAVIPIVSGGHYHVALSNYYWLATGNHTVKIVADAVDPGKELNSNVRGILRNNMISESNEGNNVAEISLTQSSSSSSSVSSSSSSVQAVSCTDSDGGDRVDVAGTVNTPGGFFRDHCENSTDLNSRLIEYTCSATGMASRYVTCPYGCDQGACEPQGGGSCVRIADQQTCAASQRGGRQCAWNAAIGLCGDSGGSGNAGSCTDSDGGERYDVRGSLSTGGFGGNDYCDSDTKLNEYFCAANGDMGARSITCPYGCSDGRCVSRSGAGSSSSAPVVPQCSNGLDDNNDGLVDMQDASCKSSSQAIEGRIDRCTDSDGGQNAQVRGEVIGYEAPNVVDRWTDYCGTSGEEAGKLVEYVCQSDNYGKKVLLSCPQGCQNGACLAVVSNTQQPDLVIQNLQFVKQSSDLSTIEFDVANIGQASVKDWFSMDVYIDGSIYSHTYYGQQKVGTRYGVDSDAVIPILSGGSYHVALSNYSWLTNGNHTIKIVADAVNPGKEVASWYRGIIRDNMISESNEGNNAATIQISLETLPRVPQTVSSSSAGTTTWTPPTIPTPPSSSSNFEDVVRTPSAGESRFTDVGTDTLEGKAANALAQIHVIGGYPDGEFKGSKLVNRAEAAKFLLIARYGSVPDMQNNGRFPDVLSGEWYEKFVMYAANLGIIKGHDDGFYRPANSVNTAEFLKMLTLTFGLEVNLPHSYLDVNAQAWFAPYAGVADKYDLFPNRDPHYLQPSRELTRDEVAVAIYRYLQSAGNITQ